MRIRHRETIGTRLHRLYFWLWDDMYDQVPERFWDRLEQIVEHPARWLLCKLYGHEATPDQCNIPAHDFCVWCHRSMPDMAPRKRVNA